jgi:di/tricarboxylate transporter
VTTEITLTLAILLTAVFLLVREKLRVDLVALLVLLSLAISGLVSTEEALSGFSNPAVVTVWAVFILSAGLARTGVANIVGKYILRLGGKGERRMILIIMLIAGGLSAFMNNVGVAAMLLPVVMHVSRKTGRPASRLLMPLAFGSLLGGMTTMIGTPPNILVSDAMQDFGLTAFSFFDYAKVGLPVMLVGVAYIVLIGHRQLPSRNLAKEFQLGDVSQHFDLAERFFVLKVPNESLLVGKSLADSRLGSALRLNVIRIQRKKKSLLAPEAAEILQAGDELLVLGRSDWFDELSETQQFHMENTNGEGKGATRLDIEDLVSTKISIIEAAIPDDSPLVGQSLAQSDFRAEYEANVLAIWQDELPLRTGLQNIVLHAQDRILIQATRAQLNALSESGRLEIADLDSADIYKLENRLMLISLPNESGLAGMSLLESRLADAFGLSVLGIIREGTTLLMPVPTEKLRAGDKLVVEGKVEVVDVLSALQDLEVLPGAPPALSDLESEEVGLVEVVLSPHSNLDGKDLGEANFREKFGLSVLAVLRGGEVRRSNLRSLTLRYGDSLLIYGHRNRIRLMAQEEQFLVLSPEVQAAPRREKALLASIIMAGVVFTAGMGWMPIALAAIAGAAAMILTDCLNMEEAYRAIQWQAIFLIAGMLPLGIAMQNSGTARYLASQVIGASEAWGPIALMAAIFLLTTLAAQVMPNAVVAVLMVPIALNTASDLGYSAQSLAMLVALGASTNFITPVGHPANILVMGPGGYRFKDFTKVGLPLTILIMITVLIVLPYYWPLIP